MRSPRLATVELPEFGLPEAMPVLPDRLYRERMARLSDAMARAGYERLLVYADREHSANLAYLTGFDPRFEEALLIVGAAEQPLLLTGNECVGMAAAAPLPMRVELFQDFSLPAQPRDRSRLLPEVLESEGIVAGCNVGVVGWKTYSRPDQHDVPSYLIDAIRDQVGDASLVANATPLLIDADHGLRVGNEVEQLAWFEWAACHTSEGVKRLLRGLEIGMTEQEAVQLLQWNGTPLSCHLMLTAGERATLGLLSPSDRPIQRGDRFTTAFGIWGALNCRAGFVVAGADELPDGISDYVDKLVAPYFAAIVEWYEALHVGQRGGVLHEIVDRHLGDPFFGIFLNPGHQIHLDEWVNSPIAEDSQIRLRSGMAFQADVIPATGTEYFTTNIEDGLALADEDLRTEIARSYPGMWRRIQARRRFMEQGLGIRLHADVLPFSNIPAYLAPFLLRPDLVMTVPG
ncbi:MAG: aminopeptidase P family N-terminal domain-containing protein [Acidimicrobiia bacterium]|nr:aminopeptidase P family N-terminal domain-containing protein [Acidimicrobiia bacterium]